MLYLKPARELRLARERQLGSRMSHWALPLSRSGTCSMNSPPFTMVFPVTMVSPLVFIESRANFAFSSVKFQVPSEPAKMPYSMPASDSYPFRANDHRAAILLLSPLGMSKVQAYGLGCGDSFLRVSPDFLSLLRV